MITTIRKKLKDWQEVNEAPLTGLFIGIPFFLIGIHGLLFYDVRNFIEGILLMLVVGICLPIGAYLIFTSATILLGFYDPYNRN